MSFVVCKRCANISFQCFTNDYYYYYFDRRSSLLSYKQYNNKTAEWSSKRRRRRCSHTAFVWLLDWNVWYAKTQNVSSSKTLKNMYITHGASSFDFNSISIKVTLLFLLAFESEAGVMCTILRFNTPKLIEWMFAHCALHTVYKKEIHMGFFLLFFSY